MSSWFERNFCKDIARKLEAARAQNLRFDRAFGLCEKSRDRAKLRLHECRTELEGVYERLKASQTNEAYYSKRVRKLLQALASAIVIPDITRFFNGTTIKKVEPLNEPALIDWDLVCADIEYYAFTFEVWKNIAESIQAVVKRRLKRSKKDVADCDNWALTMETFLALAFGKSGLDRQGAFMVAWSRKHAYNAFLDVEGKVWIYEPQEDKVMGLLGETGDLYETEKLWFPH